ncbi:MAG: hypothetical protein KF830_12250 [Planctomycetes bacterium]|nr:hypothetical protein [Planctomycetota bacterium]
MQAHSTWWVALSLVGVLSLALTVVLLPVVVVRLPDDYFAASRDALVRRRSGWAWFERIVRNAFGVVFVLAGVAMLVLPGQGLLTILIGLLLVDFPGKRRLERRLVQRPRVLALLNRLRARHGRPPLRLE